MEFVLKRALQKDSPVCAVWMPVLYLGTENTFALSVPYSAVGGQWLGKIRAVLSFMRILRTPFQWSCSLLESQGRTLLHPVSLPQEQVINPPYTAVQDSGSYCKHSLYLAEKFCHDWTEYLSKLKQGNITSSLCLPCGVLYFFSFF